MNLKHIQRSSQCLNCNHPLDAGSDNFCPHCGQVNNVRKEKAHELLSELAGDFLHLDSKVMGSVIPLLFKPGTLTVQYNEGKRARFLHPVRMFISIMIIFVIVMGITNGKDHESSEKVKKLNDSTEVVNFTGLHSKDGKVSLGEVIDTISKEDQSLKIEMEKTDFADSVKLCFDKGITEPEAVLNELHHEHTWWNKFKVIQAYKIYKFNTENGAEGFGEYLLHKLPWIIFSMLPVFAFLMYLLYYRKRILYVDHLIYAFHVHTFFFLFLSVFMLLDQYCGSLPVYYLLLYIPVYFYLAMRKVYQQGRSKTFFKMCVLSMMYSVAVVFVFLLATVVLFLFY
jgi:predicted RNA-binding Zn-ribbon protein involved in translation (DUF1610 family)